MAQLKADLQTGAVHIMGNGRLFAAAMGLSLLEVVGPPYSSASLLSLTVSDTALTHTAARSAGTAVWNHELLREEKTIGCMAEFVDAQLPVYIRRVWAREPVRFDIEVLDTAEQIQNGAAQGLKPEAGLLLQHDAGIFVYGHYPSPKPLCYQILTTGAASIQKVDENRYALVFEKGEGCLFVAGGDNLCELTTTCEQLLCLPYEAMCQRTVQYWHDYRQEGYDPAEWIPENTPLREELVQAFDDVSVLMKAQQGESGGCICGSVFHWAALRDQYGVSRSFLAQGHLKEARAILQYYWDIWQKRGALHNGQDIGLDGFFHIHENDDVEITGYLVIQAFDYLKASGDRAFLLQIMPMLVWAFEAQKKHLWHHMLPFNGDETYIAGGVLPRNTLNDGSAEATMLFWTGGIELLAFIKQEQLWPKQQIEENLELLTQVQAHYRDNFLLGGKLATNNPARKEGLVLPRFRHGVCEACWDPPHYTFGWTERNENDRYVCPACKAKGTLERAPDTIYYLRSVSMMPFFLRSPLLTRQEVTDLMEDIILHYRKTGRLPSRPDGNTTVGYDYGLLLYNLTELAHPLAGEIYERMLSVLDERGAWAEFYEDDRPAHTRCRPWESGINLLAGLKFAQTFR